MVSGKSRLLQPNLPVILMTGDGSRFPREMAESAGADAYLLKPFRRTELLGKIGEFTELRAASPARS